MFEDLENLVDEFDLYGLTHPASAEQFIMNLVVIAILCAAIYAFLKILGRLF